ncbi:TetR/AcrR family transcriptional regulator [Streptomyces sp. NPDC050504]|uniref:TetR/AcrR family transcriptional regulator n=1 Tax=Streptomyces sp. NPDC050504 TaxID=3365618 RepID=UPI0037A7EA26
MTSIRGARERARIELTAAIKDEARRQLAAEGAAKLSLRAVARELGMASSAIYRYYPSRDELLTALIVDAYDAIGEAAESALAPAVAPTPSAPAAPSAPSTTRDLIACWVDVCRATRAWALAHPHEYALIYGSPVPGYSAPQTTTGPAARVAGALISLVREAHRTKGLAVPVLPAALRAEAERLAADVAPDLPPAVGIALATVWAQLFGLISFEVFGQFNRVVEERDAFFAHAAAGLAREVGLTGP